MQFDLGIDDIESWIRDRGFTSVALQLPEGLKLRATELADRIYKDTRTRAVIIGYPCYGACDLFVGYKRFAQGLVHFGHSPIPNLPQDPDVLYIEVRALVSIDGPLKAALSRLPARVGLLASVQYIGLLPQARELLEHAGYTALIGRGDARLCYPGQVLGCDCSAATALAPQVDGFLFLGEGDFHPLAAALGVAKPMQVLNPVTGELRDVDDVRDRILRRRFAAIETAKGAHRFLVIVCSKVGQYRPEAADRLEMLLQAAGKEVTRLVTDEVSPQALLPYRVDAYVSTACPRIALDDAARYSHPMLTVPETEIVLGLRSWDNYIFDMIS